MRETIDLYMQFMNERTNEPEMSSFGLLKDNISGCCGKKTIKVKMSSFESAEGRRSASILKSVS